jgi:tricorn protease-like protein
MAAAPVWLSPARWAPDLDVLPMSPARSPRTVLTGEFLHLQKGAMNNFMRFFLLFLWVSLLVSLAGCGGGESNATRGVGPAPPLPSGTPIIAFLSQITGTGNYRIRLMTDRGAVIPVGSPDKFNYVQLSPDGKKIVYSLADGDGWYFWIGIMNSDGSAKTTLTATDEFDLYPQFTPDGTKIIYESVGNNLGIILMNADGTNPQNLTNQYHGYGFFEPTVSPDGKTIAASFCNSSVCGLATMNIDGSGLQVIQTCDAHTQFLGEPAFSADSTKIFFSYMLGPYYAQNTNIYVVNVDGTNLTQLTNSSYDWCPVVVGDKVLFVSTRDSQTHDPSESEIYEMSLDGSGIARLTHNRINDTFIGYPLFGRIG